MKRIVSFIFAATVLSIALHAGENRAPKFANIVNFVREIEPRIEEITPEVLYQTTAEQVLMMKEYGLKGTFLLQYDAMIDYRYQYLLKIRALEGTEIGAWWEITQPHVEAAGLEWRGAYPWDWHANVGFSTGYTPEEREKLVDVYMEKFMEIFGYYPKSVGSWFIDAHTLEYMYEKYGIVASCTCKDQYGTDGYTMWGGYWNQAYYPSRVNAFMPAQTEEGQIPVPVFRMLGSDPVYQYDCGLGTQMQGVITLEPVVTDRAGGGVPEWVDWYMNMIAKGECLTFNYFQAGQENSFTWERMEGGFKCQIPLIKKMADSGLLTVATLEECGQWFKDNFKVTPPTSVVSGDDFFHQARQSIWYNSRFYRANLYWDGVNFRFRDIHLFDEAKKSDYIDKAGTSTKCVYTTLPVVDGFLWSTQTSLAGLRLFSNGEEITVGVPTVKRKSRNVLVVSSMTRIGRLKITLKEDKMEVKVVRAKDAWSLDLGTAPEAVLPFKEVTAQTVNAEEYDYPYSFSLLKGTFEKGGDCALRMVPAGNRVTLCTSRQ